MKTEKIFAGIFIVALVMKFMRISGGNVSILFVLTILALLYLLFSFYFLRDSKTRKQKLWLSLFSGLIFFILLTGILFRLLYWPGATAMLNSGLFFGAIHLLIVILIKNKITDELKNYFDKLLLRSVILYGISFVFYLIPSSYIASVEFRSDPELARLKIAVIEDPANKEAHDQLLKYVEENNIGLL